MRAIVLAVPVIGPVTCHRLKRVLAWSDRNSEVPDGTGERRRIMGVQTDLRAGSGSCYKCGALIVLDVDVEVDIDINFGSRKRHRWC